MYAMRPFYPGFRALACFWLWGDVNGGLQEMVFTYFEHRVQ